MPDFQQALDDWLERLQLLHPTEIELGLSRVREVASRLGLLAPKANVITIAGTNGKGSTAKALQTLLLSSAACKQQGVGVFTSPHLFRFNERISVNGLDASNQQICEAFEVIDQHCAEISLTYFEFSTLAALWIFAQQKLAYIILEVGLGGRLDAVNILDADVAIITSIALDHQSWLGDTVDEIGLEKGGILRDGQQMIFGQSDMPGSLYTLADTKMEKDGRLSIYAGISGQGNKTNISSKELSDKLPYAKHGWTQEPSGLGWYGVDNSGSGIVFPVGFSLEEAMQVPLSLAAWSSALQACANLGVKLESSAVTRCIRETGLIGRLSRHPFRDRVFVCDVAHNPAAVQNIVETLVRTDDEPAAVVFSALEDKAISEIAEAICPLSRFVAIPGLTQTDRAVAPGEVATRVRTAFKRCSKQAEIKAFSSMEAATNWAIQVTDSGDKILVFGSFFTVAECLAHIAEQDGQQPGRD